jgi:hypothetical protein
MEQDAGTLRLCIPSSTKVSRSFLPHLAGKNINPALSGVF